MARPLQRYGPSPRETGQRIKAERERLGLTQAEAAARLGIHRGTYLQLEEGANPQLSTLCALRAIGYDLTAIAPDLYRRRPSSPAGSR